MDLLPETRTKSERKINELVEQFIQDYPCYENIDQRDLSEVARHFYYFGLEDGMDLCVEKAESLIRSIGEI